MDYDEENSASFRLLQIERKIFKGIKKDIIKDYDGVWLDDIPQNEDADICIRDVLI